MNNYLYIFVMAFVSFLIRVLPMTVIRKPIKSVFIRSFLYYVPYVTLAVMTFPAIVQVTGSPVGGAVALVIGMVMAALGLGLFPVALGCSAVALIFELIL